MSLKTGRLINIINATPLPISSEVIDYVHRIEHHALIGINFADKNKVAFPDISDDDEVVDISDSDSDNSDNDDNTSEAADPEAADPE